MLSVKLWCKKNFCDNFITFLEVSELLIRLLCYSYHPLETLDRLLILYLRPNQGC